MLNTRNASSKKLKYSIRVEVPTFIPTDFIMFFILLKDVSLFTDSASFFINSFKAKSFFSLCLAIISPKKNYPERIPARA